MSLSKSLIFALAPCAAFAQAVYWPAAQWRTATPESQGISSAALALAVDQVIQKQLGVHSLLVIRHGYLVADTYYYPYNANTPHDLASVTKTITSTLTGAAVGAGILKLDQPLLSFFPSDRPLSPDEQKQRITIGDVLRMESGLDCGYLPGEKELEQMKRSDNWVRFALSLQMKYDPGTKPSYCSPGYHLLGSAIGSAAHMTEAEFGRKYLFDPLGIKPGIWADDPQGRNHGWGDSHFFPADIAKIGYLYLHGGEWNGKQIVPADWVRMSTALPPGARTDHGGLGYEWGASNGANGRQFGGTGRGGQTLIVWPDLDMIVVSMGGGNTGQIASLVRQSVKSDKPLPEDQAAFADLQAISARALQPPAPKPPIALPATASRISGIVYEFPVNPSRLDSLALTFTKLGDARVDIKYYGVPLSLPIGLDDAYQLGPYGPFHMLAGAKGRWTSDSEFILDINFVANINHYTLNLRFNGGRLEMIANEASGLIKDGRVNSK